MILKAAYLWLKLCGIESMYGYGVVDHDEKEVLAVYITIFNSKVRVFFLVLVFKMDWKYMIINLT